MQASPPLATFSPFPGAPSELAVCWCHPCAHHCGAFWLEAPLVVVDVVELVVESHVCADVEEQSPCSEQHVCVVVASPAPYVRRHVLVLPSTNPNFPKVWESRLDLHGG